MPTDLERFVAAFARGIAGEVAAMQAQQQAFTVALARGEDLGGGRYAFALANPAGDRLGVGTACTLRTPRGDQRVTIVAGDPQLPDRIAFAASAPVDVDAPDLALVVAPWFLYDRLAAALASLHPDRHHIATALALFGKGALPAGAPRPLVTADRHAGLDASQRAAVRHCADAPLAFLWGPPGTGKTVTLTSIIGELHARGERVLLVSTTNAAIDQVIGRLATTQPWFAGEVAAGRAIRLGRSDADTHGSELADVVARHRGTSRDTRARLRARVGEAEQALRFARTLVDDLAALVSPQQSLFAAPDPGLRAAALVPVFGGLADAIAARAPRDQLRALETRIARLTRLRALAKARIAALGAADRDLEARLVAGARLVACTLTTAYLSPLLVDERFDTLIAEEAGMATLPPLFYAAALCATRAIVVGDPRQLPPIVQSDDPVVHRAIGRNIFDVTVPQPIDSPLVAMLQTQYRMHGAIGALVGDLFYAGRLGHGADRAATEAIAARAPLPGRAVAVLDTRGRTACMRSAKGTSRVNIGSAELAAALAAEAAAAQAADASIAIITPYAAQAAEIRKLLAARRLGERVECSTIHRFQGRECDVVILDLVDAPPLRQSALVTAEPNLLNVSISRARGKLVVVADVAYFAASPSTVVAALLARIAPLEP